MSDSCKTEELVKVETKSGVVWHQLRAVLQKTTPEKARKKNHMGGVREGTQRRQKLTSGRSKKQGAGSLPPGSQPLPAGERHNNDLIKVG